MKAIGIICEFNPFHRGHLYFINKIKEKYPNHLIILVLNGYFLERGEISLLSKESKTKIALNNNVDIVLELPFLYGTQSADNFANAALKILNEFKIEKLIFGSESNNLEKLKEIAFKQINSNLDIKNEMKKGLNYPTALAKAINIDFEYNANDLLGISYLKSIIKNNYQIEVSLIKRTNNYHDTSSNEEIISASNIRKKYYNNEDISKYINYDKNLINDIDYKLLFNLLKSKIITEKDLSIYLDVNEGIENKIKKVILEVNTYKELIEKLKSKRYTYNKINRMLFHILIGLLKCDANYDIDYIHVLGFNNSGKKYINQIKKNCISLNMNKDSLIYKYEKNASIFYEMLTNKKNDFEKKNKPIIK